MIAEDVLERGLAAAADSYPIPEDAIAALRASLAAPAESPQRAAWFRRVRRPRTTRAWVATAVAAVALIAGVPFIVGGGGSTGKELQQVTSTGAISSGSGSVGLPPTPTDVGTPDSVSGGAGSSNGFGSASVAPHKAVSRSVFGGTVSTKSGTTPATAGDTTASSASGGGSIAVGNSGSTLEQRVVKTGTIALQVANSDVGETVKDLAGLATSLGGYVQDSNSDEFSSTPSGAVTLRIPVARFDSAVSQASHINNAQVLSLHTQGQDVTGQYVDTAAKIRALKATRASFLTLLGRARTIGETLEVQDQINTVQSSINQLTGQLNLLAHESAYSTLTVSVDAKHIPGRKQPVHRRSGLSRSVHRSWHRFVHGVEDIIGIIGPLVLVLILLGLLWLIGWVGYRRIRRNMV